MIHPLPAMGTRAPDCTARNISDSTTLRQRCSTVSAGVDGAAGGVSATGGDTSGCATDSGCAASAAAFAAFAGSRACATPAL